MAAGVLDRRLQKPGRYALATRGATHDEAHDRPDRGGVDRGQDLGVGQPLVVLAGSEADPPDDRPALVRNEARRMTGASALPGGRREELTVLAGRRIRPIPAASAEVGAPAPARVAALVEQGREVGDAVRRQRPDVEGHCIDRRRVDDGACQVCFGAPYSSKAVPFA